jgi:hypothetical protein
VTLHRRIIIRCKFSTHKVEYMTFARFARKCGRRKAPINGINGNSVFALPPNCHGAQLRSAAQLTKERGYEMRGSGITP